MVHQAIRVRFAVGFDEADDLIEQIIARHSVPKQLTVVSSDNRIKTAATRGGGGGGRGGGARSSDSDAWLDRLIDGKIDLAVAASKYADSNPSDSGESNHESSGLRGDSSPIDVEGWMDEFGF